MKIRLLIATKEKDYAEHLAKVLAVKYAEEFEATVCSDFEKAVAALRKPVDIIISDPEFTNTLEAENKKLLLEFWDGESSPNPETDGRAIRKYQRITTLVGQILEKYSEVAESRKPFGASTAKVSAVWSPAGGCGKTTAALAYAAQKAVEGKKVLYLNLEAFCSLSAYFPQNGKSISTALEHLDGNVAMFLQGIRQQDRDSGIYYFGMPSNYEDVSILSATDITQLIAGCADGMDELVIDLSSIYDARTREILELADEVMLVADGSPVGLCKLSQFKEQHDLFQELEAKIVAVANRGSAVPEGVARRSATLPTVQSADPAIVIRALSTGYFAS